MVNRCVVPDSKRRLTQKGIFSPNETSLGLRENTFAEDDLPV